MTTKLATRYHAADHDHLPPHTDATKCCNSQLAVETAVQAALDQKALDVVALDVRDLTDITDFLIVASGTSQRHVSGIADRIVEALRNIDQIPHANTGIDKGEWVALDYTDFLVHVFHEPVRDYYRLEQLWSGAKPAPLEDALTKATRRSRTGLFNK